MDNEDYSMKSKHFILTFSILTLLLVNVSAFAVSSQYWEENPLRMQPGETRDIQIMLQNLAGTEDVSVQGTITESSDIAEIIDEDNLYTVNAGEKTFVSLRITIPEEENMNEYNLVLSFKTSEEGEGSFGLGNSVEREIPIMIQPEAKKINENLKTWIIIILAISVIVLIILFSRRENKKSKKKKKKK